VIDTWESRKNLQNVADLLKKFKEEYRRDNRDIRQQERVDNKGDYFKGGLPGCYTARRLFGWSDGKYNHQY